MSEVKVRDVPGERLDLNAATSQVVFGIHDANLRLIEAALGVEISARDHDVFVEGDAADVATARRILAALGKLAARGVRIRQDEVKTAIRIGVEQPDVSIEGFFVDTPIETAKGRRIRPKGPNQAGYLEAIRTHDVVFAVGPAGTGKTFLAMAMAIEALNSRRVRRIILARPAIEAGEKLGFLPGDMIEKVNPYLRPLYDALYTLVGFDQAERLIARNQIEIAPLAFMRGRTLSDAFVILDEAQNTTPDQMKMLLTRLGIGSKAVVNGDITQVDLAVGTRSGLVDAREVLGEVDGIAHVAFDKQDVVRHDLVRKIVSAYEERERRTQESANAGSAAPGSE